MSKSAEERATQLQALAHKAFAQHSIRERSEGRWVLQKKHTEGEYAGKWESCYWTEIIVLSGGSLLVHGDISSVIFSHYSDDRVPENVLRWMGSHPNVDCYVAQKAAIGMGGSQHVQIRDDEVMEAEIREKVKKLRESLARECSDGLYLLLEDIETTLDEDAEGVGMLVDNALQRLDSCEEIEDSEDSAAYDTEEALEGEWPQMPKLKTMLTAARAALGLGLDTPGMREKVLQIFVQTRNWARHQWVLRRGSEDEYLSAWCSALEEVEGGDSHEALETLHHSCVDCEEYCDLGMVTDAKVFFAHAAIVRLCALLGEERCTGPESEVLP